MNDLYELIKPLMEKAFNYIKNATDDEFRARFKSVVLGSTGYHQYFFQLYNLIADDIPALRPEGYDEYQKMTSRDLAESADRNVKWIQAAVPAFIKEKLRDRLGESWFEQAVSKEVQKSCQARRIDADPDEKLSVEEYLGWIQFVDLARNKEIRDDVKDVVSIRLPDEAAGKHFYAQWFDTINRLRRVAAHPSGRAYKPADIDTLSFVVDHLKARLPEHYAEGGFDASVS